MAKTKKAHAPRNRPLMGSGLVMRFSRSEMASKTAIHKKKFKKTEKAPLDSKKKTSYKLKFYPTSDVHQRLASRKKAHSKIVHKIRPSITPGTILIVVAGPHRGKRVIFLKQFTRTGSLLVTGPFKINGCPLLRIDQRFVIATSQKLDISNVKLAANLDDAYFNKPKTRKPKKSEDIFASEKTREVSEEKKQDQKTVDEGVLTALKKDKDSKLLLQYLKSRFGLSKAQYPHEMKF